MTFDTPLLMEEVDGKPQAHLFICTRKKDSSPCCANRGSEQLVENLKTWLKSEQLHKTLKVSSTSCLGYCDTGITACLYPQNQWFHRITLEDEENLKKKLLKVISDQTL